MKGGHEPPFVVSILIGDITLKITEAGGLATPRPRFVQTTQFPASGPDFVSSAGQPAAHRFRQAVKIYGCEMIRISSRGGRLPPQQTTFGPNESYAAVGLRDTANILFRQQQAARDIWGHLRSPFNKRFLNF